MWSSPFVSDRCFIATFSSRKWTKRRGGINRHHHFSQLLTRLRNLYRITSPEFNSLRTSIIVGQSWSCVGKFNIYTKHYSLLEHNNISMRPILAEYLCQCVCEKEPRLPVALPLDANRTPLTPDSSDKSSFVSESCLCSEKVSGGECEIRSSLFFFCNHVFHFLALQMYGGH